MHAWGGYKEFAWGNDELEPVAKKGQDVRLYSIAACLPPPPCRLTIETRTYRHTLSLTYTHFT